MVPTAIVQRAKTVGLEMIAVCDHNSFANAASVARAGERECLQVLPGVEITTREEVHLLGLFQPGTDLTSLQTLIDEHLPGENDEATFGPQVLVDEHDEPTALERKLLIGATTLTLEQVVDAIHATGGLAIAAHVDREGFGLIGQLGFIPPALALDALEVSPRVSPAAWNDRWPTAFPVITSSDAHRLADIGKSSTTFRTREASFRDIGSALVGRNDCKVVVH